MRNVSLDYLRCLCTAIIICLHITGCDIDRMDLQNGGCEFYYTLRLLLALGVPPFFMLSGAFMISKEIDSILHFYARSYSRLLPWSLFFFLVGSVFTILNTAYNEGSSIWDTEWLDFYSRWFLNGGSGVLWFIPALMGLYLITPLLVWIRKHISLSNFCILTILVILATEYILTPWLHMNYESYPYNWLKGIFFIGHYMLGYCIYRTCQKLPSSWPCAKLIGGLFLVSLFCIVIFFSHQYPDPTINCPNLHAQAFIPIILSSLLFAFFAKCNLPSSSIISTVSSISIIIYLSHNYLPLPIIRFCLKWTGLWDTLYRDTFIMSIICYIIAVPFSIICAIILQKSAHIFFLALKKAFRITTQPTQQKT